MYDGNFFNFTNVDYNNDMMDIFFFIQLLIVSLVGGFMGYLLFEIFSDNINTVYIVRGLPGSGKTTWIDEHYKKVPNSIVINMDEYITGNGDTLRRGHIRTVDVLLHLLNKGDKYTNIFIEGVFSKTWEYEVLETLAELYDVVYD